MSEDFRITHARAEADAVEAEVEAEQARAHADALKRAATPPRAGKDGKAGADGGKAKGGAAGADAAKVKGEPVKGAPSLLKPTWEDMREHPFGPSSAAKLGDRLAERAGTTAGKLALKTGGRLLPVVGSLLAAGDAYKDFKRGDMVGAALNAVGVVPGPVGWIGLGAGTLWDMFADGGGGHGSYGLWDQPNGTNTSMLPASAKDEPSVKNADVALMSAQRKVFGFADGPSPATVWDSNPPRSDA
jgi:hypothetical protein